MVRVPQAATTRAAALASRKTATSLTVSSSWRLAARRGYASEAAAGPKKSFVRRFVLPTTLLTAAVYGAGTYASFENDTVHDFFVERVPGGEALVSYFQRYDLETPGSYSKKAIASGEDAYKTAKEKVVGQGQRAKTAMERDLEMQKQRANISKITEKTALAVDKAEREAQAAVAAAENKAQEMESQAGQKTKDLGKEVETALSAPAPSGSEPSKSNRPRELDATPQPLAKPELPAYPGQIPLGFEAPPGYSGSALRPRDPTVVAPSAEVERPAPPPLPLVAPAVRDLSASEPVLGQLAATIDSLAGFLRDAQPAASDQAGSGNGSAKDVLTAAELDLKNLGKRLEGVKAEERAALEKRLDEQAKEYSAVLLAAERELHERLDKQESDWKTAFDTERQALVQAYKQKLEIELDTQQEIINERLKEEVIRQGIEMQRRWVRDVKLSVEQERGGRLAKLEELEGGLKKLERVTLDNEEYLDENLRIHRLWNAVRATNAVLESSSKQPLEAELRALRVAASKSAPAPEGDPASTPGQPDMIKTALECVPESAVHEGIDSFSTLSTWYLDCVAPKLRSASLLPEQAGLFSYMASHLLSKLLFTQTGYIEGDDVASVMSRVEVLLGKKDLDRAARELNQLRGWPKVLARDWLEAARRHLEVKQALELTETEARLESLLL